MGYYTFHTIDVETGSHTVTEIYKAMRELKNDIFYGISFPRNDEHLSENNSNNKHFYLDGRDSVKWYTEPEDMKEFSMRFPDALFTVHGEGEEQEDVWEHRYKNGVQKIRRIETKWGEWY